MDNGTFSGPPADHGVLGAGQLAKLYIEQAHEKGETVLVYAQRAEEPAVGVADYAIVADFNNRDAWKAFARRVRYATLESENVPVGLVGFLENEYDTVHNRIRRIRKRDYFRTRIRGMHPSSRVLLTGSDRNGEYRLFTRLGIPAPRSVLCNTLQSVSEEAIGDFPYPAFLKRNLGGYDGRGQKLVRDWRDVSQTYLHEFHQASCRLYERVDFAYELSVIVVRNAEGLIALYDPIENRHEGGILIESRCPGPSITPEVARLAKRLAARIAICLDLVGILVVEMFVTKSGEVLVNEVAPRPHNSGHGTIEGNETSQFEQLRLVLQGHDPGPTRLKQPWVMRNLLGVTLEQALALTPRGSYLHLYNKEPKKDRKVGHITTLLPD